jgi:hypothetical protein
MTDQLAGFPFWLLSFDEDGVPVDADAVANLVSELKAQRISDLFVFSHGWNNDRTTALKLYKRFFEQMREVLDAAVPASATTRIGVAGVLWPSILWPDDAENATMTAVVPSPSTGGGASFGSAPAAPMATAAISAINGELRKAYPRAEARALVDELTAMLERHESSDAALQAFRQKLAQLLTSARGTPLDPKHVDDAEAAMVNLDDAKWRGLLQSLGNRATKGGPAGGGSVGSLNPFTALWTGAKEALRVASYWNMKMRAGVVGSAGLGARVLASIARDAPGVRVHLIGHSFGARLVSFSLAGMPDALQGGASPVKSLFLLQGAFSHYAFADRLPHDNGRAGALKGMASRVDGPLLTTHSLRDLAVGRSYPAASFANGDDSAGFEEQIARWGAVGHDGEQAVNAASDELSPPGKRYAFKKGEWLNLDGNKVIIHGGLPSGAHSDIVHPHTAWAALAAAQVV